VKVRRSKVSISWGQIKGSAVNGTKLRLVWDVFAL
jgi:hypothetical protein